MKINLLPKKEIKEKTLKLINIVSLFALVFNMSMVGVFISPPQAQAVTSDNIQYKLQGQKKNGDFTTGNICSGTGSDGCYAEGENVPFKLTINGLTVDTTYTAKIQHDFEDNHGYVGYENFNTPGSWDGSATDVTLTDPVVSPGQPNTITYNINFKALATKVELKWLGLLGQDAGEWNGAQLHVRLVEGVQGEPIGNKEVPIQVNKIVIRDLSVDKTDNPDPINLGEATTYTITITNTGEKDEMTEVVDTLPTELVYVDGSGNPLPTSVSPDKRVLTWSNLAVPMSPPDTIITFEAEGVEVGTGLNQVTVTASGLDPVSADEETTVVGVGCDLVITKLVDKTEAFAGDTLTYTLYYTNKGDDICTGGGVKIYDDLDDYLTFNGNHTETLVGDIDKEGIDFFGNFNGVDPVANAHVVSPGEEGTITFEADISEDIPCGETIIPNQASIWSNETGTLWSNIVQTKATKICHGYLEVNKIVDTGPGDPLDWTFTVEGPGGPYLMKSGDILKLDFGTYTVTESSLSDYHFNGGDGYEGCSFQGEMATVVIDVPDQEPICDFHNAHDEGDLTIHKEVDLDGDGIIDEYDPAGWTWDLDGGDQNYPMGSTQSVLTGTHTVSEDQHAGYHSTGWRCSDGTSGLGEVLDVEVTTCGVECTFTNVRDTGALKVFKYVDSGEATPDQWEFTIPGYGTLKPNPGEDYVIFYNLPTDTYTVTESDLPGYHQASTTCNNVEVKKDEMATCEFHNARDRGSLKVIKYVDSGDAAPDQWSFTLENSGVILSPEPGTNYVVFRNLPTGTYTVRESELAGYHQASTTCDNVPVDDNSLVPTVCEFHNARDLGTVRIEKIVSGGTAQPTDWSFSIDGVPQLLKHGNEITLPTGTYNIREAGPGDYSLTSATGICSHPDGGSATLTVTNETSIKENRTCIFTNTRDKGTIEGIKFNDLNGNEINDNDNEPGVEGVTIRLSDGKETKTNQDGYYVFSDLDTGTYTVSEVVPDGWINTTDNPVENVVVEKDKTETVNFGNFQLGKISGYKLDDLDNKLNDWEICLENNCVFTGSGDWPDGYYEFDGLTYGTYTLSETMQDGWVSLSSPEAIELVSGTVSENNNFVNYRIYPDLTVEKDDGLTSADPGDTLTYVIDYSNQGDWEAADVTVVDTLPDYLTYVSDTSGVTPSVADSTYTWLMPGLGVGESNSFELTVQIDSPMPEGTTTLHNEVSVSTTTEEPNTDNNADDDDTKVTVVVGEPTLSIVKLVDKSTASPGDKLNYSLAWTVSGAPVTNLKVMDTVPDNTIFDSLPEGEGGEFDPKTNVITWHLGDKSPGDTGTLNFTVETLADLEDGTLIENMATVESEETSNESNKVVTIIEVAPILTITKSVNADFVNPGDTVDYTVVVENTGQGTAYSLELKDVLPDGFTFTGYNLKTKTWALGDLAPGDKVSTTYNVSINSSQAAGTYDNLATAWANNHEEITDKVSLEVRIPVVLGEEAEPQLEITKTVDVGFANPGQTVNYTIRVENVGQATAFNVQALDVLPAGFTFSDGEVSKAWPLGDLRPGESKEVTYAAIIGEEVEAGNYENMAITWADNHDQIATFATLEIRTIQVLAAELPETGSDMLDWLYLLAAGTLLMIILQRELKFQQTK